MPSPADPILFQAGPFVIRWYGLLIVSGALAAAYIASIEARRKKEDPDHALECTDLVFNLGNSRRALVSRSVIPGGGSRGFSYYFIEQPFTTITLFGAAIPFPTALMIWQGGIGIYGALLGGILAVYIYARRHHLNFWRWLDNIAPGMLLAQAIGRWGNFFNQELYGPPTNLPWGITITNANQRIPPYNDLTAYPLETTAFHPVFLYESLWNVVGFGLLMWIARKYAHKLLDGDLLSLYLIWYSVGRIMIEFLRPDAWTIGAVPTAQLVGAALILIGIGLMIYRRRTPALATNPFTHPTQQPKRRRRRS